MITQEEMILKHLQKNKKQGITSLEAIYQYGITRLSARICNLRKQGYQIRSKLVPVTARNGHTCYVSRYTLEA